MESAFGGMLVLSVLVFIALFILAVVIMRWAFRINDIVTRLDKFNDVLTRLDRISMILGEAFPAKRENSK